MKFIEFAEICEKLESITSNLEMTGIISKFLKSADTLDIVTRFIEGSIFPAWSSEELNIGPSLLYDAIAMATGAKKHQVQAGVRELGDAGLACEKLCEKKMQRPLFAGELTVGHVYKSFEAISRAGGKGSQKKKAKMLADLFGSARPKEARYIARLVLEELRIGVGEGIVRDAIVQAFDVSKDEVERAYMLTNDLGLVAVTAKKGVKELRRLDIELGRPIKMMLAQVAKDVESTIEEMGEVALECKYDGARVQIHKTDSGILLYSRRLENITKSLPDIVDMVKDGVSFKQVILEGEVIAMGEDGKPRPFQDILRRFRRKHEVERIAREIPLHLSLFDILFLDGEGLIHKPLVERRRILEKSLKKDHSPMIEVAPQTITGRFSVAERIYKGAISAGHEGVMVKNPKSMYTPGKRGKNWLKVKPVAETLDLVVVGGMWGEGKRANLIGSYSLACRNPTMNSLLDIGKVGTGMTDEQLVELTELFKDLVLSDVEMDIQIKPEIVFEIGYEEIQRSSNYKSGFALRFPRLVRVREDKSVKDADTIERVQELYKKQKGQT